MKEIRRSFHSALEEFHPKLKKNRLITHLKILENSELWKLFKNDNRLGVKITVAVSCTV